MAVDKLVDSTQLNADLTSVADAIRAKGGTSASLAFPAGFVDAIGDIETGGGVTVSPLSVTANGTYTAPSGEAYSPVTVNVSGGGGTSNVVTGTFTGTTTGAAMDVPLNYSGNGYPIQVMIRPEEGPYNSNGTFYSLIQRYAINMFFTCKNYLDISPVYGSTDISNSYMSAIVYKNSISSATVYGRNSESQALLFNGNSASQSTGNCIKFKNNTTMSVYIASTSYGFAANIEYTYYVIYSE